MSIVLLSGDLMTASKVSAVASGLGLTCTTAMSPAALLDQLAEETRLVVLDLSLIGLTPSTLVPKIRTSRKVRPRIIAFGPHVHGELLEEAETSGCDVVVSRGEFFARLSSLLTEIPNISPSP